MQSRSISDDFSASLVSIPTNPLRQPHEAHTEKRNDWLRAGHSNNFTAVENNARRSLIVLESVTDLIARLILVLVV